MWPQLDNAVVGTFQLSSTNYTDFTTDSFFVDGGSHTLTFQGLNNQGGDNTVLLDTVTLD